MNRNICEQIQAARMEWRIASELRYHPAEIERRRELLVLLVSQLQSQRRGPAPVHFPSLCA
jgi:hypothetical protein